MKNIFIIITLNIACVFLCFSQPTPKQLTDEEPRNYDVLKYDLSVDWVDIMPTNKGEIDKRQWDAKLEIILTPLQNNFSLVELDAIELKINKIWINDNELKDIPNNSNGILAIPIPTLNIGDTVSILLDYTYNNPYNIGFFHRNSWMYYFEEIDAPLAGTLCEPQDSRYWLPCNDRPNDKAIVNIAATVPAGMLAAANGSLDSTVTTQQNNIPYSTTFYWTSKHPMPPYLMTITVAEYVLHTEKIPISSTKEDSIDVYYYTWEHYWDGLDYNLSRITASTNKTMQIFSDLFGDYPFEKYGIATTDYSLLGYRSLGMEHQTLTTISIDWTGNFMPIPEFTSFAHELAHSWFGNMVTCYTWKDIWFNEGGASWLEAVYLENIRDYISTGEYYNHMKNHRSTYLRGKSSIYEQPLYLADGVDAFSNSALIYSKAAWVFHQLRMLLGDNVFELFKQLLEEHKFANITSQEFVDFFVNNVPNPPNNVDIKRFLEQFIFQAGHPIYNIYSNVTKTNDGYNVDVVLNQTQSANNVPDEFLMKLNIEFLDKNNNIIYTDSIINDKRQQSYQFRLASEPAKVILDTTKALFEVSGNFLLDDISTYNSDILIYPNPVNNDKLTIRFQSNAMPINWQQQIELIDISSNSHKIIISQMDNNTISMDISVLPAGVYFLKINGSNIYKIIKI